MKRILTACAVLGLFAAVASAQSLGDVAKKEEARRKAVAAKAAKGKVYTNEHVGGEAKQPAPPGGDASASQPSSSAAAAEQPAPEAAAKDPKKEESYWRNKMKDLRDQLQRARTFEEALQSRINALTADFTNRDDPAQRNVIGADRQKALAELDRVRNDIKAGEKAITDLEEDARKAGVPAGWVR
jgi:hypothetical protein